MAEWVKIVEVGPRDGLQNEALVVPTPIKVELIERLAAAGCRFIEATSFVSAAKIPQLADAERVMSSIRRAPGVVYSALTPNLRGYEAAIAAGADEIAVFAAASETFSQNNINCSIEESLARFAPVLDAAKQAGVKARGYVSCAISCPYEGDIAPEAVARVAARLAAMGCREISLGDTIGTGTPNKIRRLIETVAQELPVAALAGHFHDTYGMAIANICASLDAGVRVFDSSVGGLGGCPYAPGASGNVATEDVAWLMRGMGVETGLDLEKLIACAWWIGDALGRQPHSRVARAAAVSSRRSR
jgi:hydroxymethylglutaryl-CoA lyase